VYVTVRCPSACLSVSPYVCPIYRPQHAAAAGLLLWARSGWQEISIDRGGRRAPQQHGTQQHGVEQQMRVV